MGKEYPVYVGRTDLEEHMTSAGILPLAIMLAATSMVEAAVLKRPG
jgi:hypothetical protein